jgi:hypothetical protein
MKKVSVTQRALVQRINRALMKDGETLRSDRRGRYMRIDLSRNSVIEMDVDLAEVGKNLSVLKAWETFEK